MSIIGPLTFLSLLACGDKDEAEDDTGTGATAGSTTSGSIDADNDGYAKALDCDDDNPDVNPAADEVCNGIDDDCDGGTDNDPIDGNTYFIDADGDGYGTPSGTVNACSLGDGYVDDTSDCDDSDASINPDTVWYTDGDGDGYGDGVAAVQCLAPSGSASVDGDCADSDYTRHPGADEYCDNIDNDCDDVIDEDAVDAVTYYSDLDGDGFGDPNNPVETCWLTDGLLEDTSDCDDTDKSINPEAEEVCSDKLDHDCSGRPDNTCNDQTADDAADVFEDDGATSYSAWDLANLGNVDGNAGEELIVTSPAAGDGTVYIVSGGTSSSGTLAGSASATIVADNGEERWGDHTVVVPDVTGEGDVDFVTSATSHSGCSSYSCGAVVLFSGNPTGNLGTSDGDWAIQGSTGGDYLGSGIAGGDVTDDGNADLLISSPGADSYAGRIDVFEGPVSDKSTPVATISGGVYARIGDSMGQVADINGDGIGDATFNGTETAGGEVYVMFGPLSGTLDTKSADVVIAAGSAAGREGQFGQNVNTDGDVDGDGYTDIIGTVPWSRPGAVYVFSQPPAAADLGDAVVTIETGVVNNNLGSDIDVADVDGDGKDDLLLGDSEFTSGSDRVGAANLFYGDLSGYRLSTSADVTFEGTTDAGYFGSSLTLIDFTSGGNLEVVVAEGQWSANNDVFLFDLP